MRALSTISLVLFATLPGCAFVSRATYEEKIASLDEDGDGVPAGFPDDPAADCDDNDDLVNPTLLEVPYDGRDNDCAGGDEVDVDGDGFPGILQADWVPVGQPGVKPTWPTDVSTDVLDCLEVPMEIQLLTGTIQVQPAQVFPGNPQELWNDAIDSNCDRANDFDADGDRYMADGSRDPYAAYVTAWGYGDVASSWWPVGNSAPAFGDCDDETSAAASSFPGASGELPYDGVDTNCDGANDFDQDGDGWIPTRCSASDCASMYAAYRSRYEYPLPASPSVGDCLDVPGGLSVDGAPVDASSVHPSADDLPNDGIDADCAQDNDYDDDGDTWIDDGELDDFNTYVAAWSAYIPAGELAPSWQYEGVTPQEGDCQDGDDATDGEIHPGSLERLGDRVDQDCDGSTDTTAAQPVPGMTWSDPRELRAGINGEHLVLVATAAEVRDAGAGSQAAHRGVVLRYGDRHVFGDPLALSPLIWKTEVNVVATTEIGASFDAIFEADRFLFAAPFHDASRTSLVGRSLAWDDTFDDFSDRLVSRAVNGATLWGGIAMAQVPGGGTTWSMACRGDGAMFARDQTFAGDAFDNDVAFDVDDCEGDACTFGDVCFLEDVTTDTVDGTVCGLAGCSTWTWTAGVRAPELSASQPWATTALRAAHRHSDQLILVRDARGGVTLSATDGDTTQLANTDVRDADAVWGPDGQLYIAAIINESGERKAVLYYGAPGALFRVNLTLVPDAARPPTDIALVDGPDRLLVGVARSDGVASAALDDRVETFVYAWP